METPKAIPQALSGPANAAGAADEALPWMADHAKSRAIAARWHGPVEAVHWSVVALMLFTAISVLIGAYGGHAAAPKELLPIVIDAR